MLIATAAIKPSAEATCRLCRGGAVKTNGQQLTAPKTVLEILSCVVRVDNLLNLLYKVVGIFAGDIVFFVVNIGNLNELAPARGVDMYNLHIVEIQETAIMPKEADSTKYRYAERHQCQDGQYQRYKPRRDIAPFIDESQRHRKPDKERDIECRTPQHTPAQAVFIDLIHLLYAPQSSPIEPRQ